MLLILYVLHSKGINDVPGRISELSSLRPPIRVDEDWETDSRSERLRSSVINPPINVTPSCAIRALTAA